MLEYKLKENAINIDSTSPIRDYLKSLGIEKIDSFLSTPPKEDELNPFELVNIKRCIYAIHNGFINNKKFFIQVDSDVDGITSASIFYRFFKGYYPNANIVWRMHEGKEHGVIIDTVPEDADYIILPDSGSMQLDEQRTLSNMGKTVIIIDHHSVTETLDDDNIILVNNQIGNFKNKDLSGAGVVFKVIQAYASLYPNMNTKYSDYYDLAALGILSDMMDVRSLDNNYIIYNGLHSIKNEMFKALINKQSYSISNINNPTKIDIVFYVTPLINGVIRAGTAEEKDMLFKAFIEEPYSDDIMSTYRGKERHENFYEFMARTAGNIRNKQNTTKEKCFKFLQQKIDDNQLNKNQIIVVIASKDDKVVVPQNITGLIAMELLKYYGKPVLVLRPKIENGELVYAGSGRGKKAEDFDSFLQFVRDSEYSEYGEGHNFAFGASIPAKVLNNFIQESNERLKNINFTNDYIEVDAIFNANTINYQMLYEFGLYSEVYGNSIPQPKIALEGIYHKNNVTVMGADKSTVKLTIDKLSCIKFKDKKLVEQLLSCNSGKFKIIGRPNINTWNGSDNIQLFIENIEIEPIATKSLF